MRTLVKFLPTSTTRGCWWSAARSGRDPQFPPAAAGHWRFREDRVETGIEVELTPQGTLAERIRAGKAGIPAFYCPVGPGTVTQNGKEMRKFDGQDHLLEHAVKGDFSLIRAHKADRYGNLIYRGTSRTFNATMAGASGVTIAEVDEIVEPEELTAEEIVTPGIYVQRVVVRPSSPQPWQGLCDERRTRERADG
jgi:3-oxoacid CoA-transferase A subunit